MFGRCSRLRKVPMEELSAALLSHGGSLESLATYARTDRSALAEELKRLGFSKMGLRKKVEQALVEMASASCRGAATGVTESSAASSSELLCAPGDVRFTSLVIEKGAGAPVDLLPSTSIASEAQKPSAERLQADGSAAFKDGRYAEAVSLYTAAIGSPGADDATVLSNRSAAHLLLGQAEDALDDALKAVQLRPNWGKAHGRHGAALAALDCPEEAIAAYERGLKATPDSMAMRMELSRLSRLLQLFAEARTAAPPPPTPPFAAGLPQGEVSWHGVDRVVDADVLQAQGKMAYEAGDYKEAQQIWTQALRRRPSDVKLLSNRAAAWLAMREFQQGLEDATQAIELDPSYSKALGRMGAALEGLGRPNDALAAFSRALELDPSSKHLQAEVARLTAHAPAPPPVPEAGAVSLSGLALAQECNRLGRPEQAIRELNKLITSKGMLLLRFAVGARCRHRYHHVYRCLKLAASDVALLTVDTLARLSHCPNPLQLTMRSSTASAQLLTRNRTASHLPLKMPPRRATCTGFSTTPISSRGRTPKSSASS